MNASVGNQHGEIGLCCRNKSADAKAAAVNKSPPYLLKTEKSMLCTTRHGRNSEVTMVEKGGSQVTLANCRKSNDAFYTYRSLSRMRQTPRFKRVQPVSPFAHAVALVIDNIIILQHQLFDLTLYRNAESSTFEFSARARPALRFRTFQTAGGVRVRFIRCPLLSRLTFLISSSVELLVVVIL